jgi:AraC-like DNA-binding protein
VDAAPKNEKLIRLSDVVLSSLDGNTSTEDLSRRAYHSRTQFYRLFRAFIEETPAAMRRRLLLERAAFQLRNTSTSVTDIAFDANYNSLEAFTRAFRKAFRVSPSLYRRMQCGSWHLPAPNRIHFLAPGSRQKGALEMDLFDRFAGNDFVDALCEPAETFTFGGVFAHIMTFNAHRRLMALDALRRLGVQVEGFGDPMEYEEKVAPWKPTVSTTDEGN